MTNVPSMRFQALLARTTTIHRPVEPVTYDCMKTIVVRDGTAIVFGAFGRRYRLRDRPDLLVGPEGLEPPTPAV